MAKSGTLFWPLVMPIFSTFWEFHIFGWEGGPIFRYSSIFANTWCSSPVNLNGMQENIISCYTFLRQTAHLWTNVKPGYWAFHCVSLHLLLFTARYIPNNCCLGSFQTGCLVTGKPCVACTALVGKWPRGRHQLVFPQKVPEALH